MTDTVDIIKHGGSAKDEWDFYASIIDKASSSKDETRPLHRKYKLTCEQGHIFYDGSPKATYCITCNDRSGKDIKALRDLLRYVFDKPFSKVAPDWAKDPIDTKYTQMKMYNEDLKIVFDCNISKKMWATKDKKEKMCKNNDILYIYMAKNKLTNIYIHKDKIREHIESLGLPFEYCNAVIQKIDDLGGDTPLEFRPSTKDSKIVRTVDIDPQFEEELYLQCKFI